MDADSNPETQTVNNDSNETKTNLKELKEKDFVVADESQQKTNDSPGTDNLQEKNNLESDTTVESTSTCNLGSKAELSQPALSAAAACVDGDNLQQLIVIVNDDAGSDSSIVAVKNNFDTFWMEGPCVPQDPELLKVDDVLSDFRKSPSPLKSTHPSDIELISFEDKHKCLIIETKKTSEKKNQQQLIDNAVDLGSEAYIQLEKNLQDRDDLIYKKTFIGSESEDVSENKSSVELSTKNESAKADSDCSSDSNAGLTCYSESVNDVGSKTDKSRDLINSLHGMKWLQNESGNKNECENKVNSHSNLRLKSLRKKEDCNENLFDGVKEKKKKKLSRRNVTEKSVSTATKPSNTKIEPFKSCQVESVTLSLAANVHTALQDEDSNKMVHSSTQLMVPHYDDDHWETSHFNTAENKTNSNALAAYNADKETFDKCGKTEDYTEKHTSTNKRATKKEETFKNHSEDNKQNSYSQNLSTLQKTITQRTSHPNIPEDKTNSNALAAYNADKKTFDKCGKAEDYTEKHTSINRVIKNEEEAFKNHSEDNEKNSYSQNLSTLQKTIIQGTKVNTRERPIQGRSGNDVDFDPQKKALRSKDNESISNRTQQNHNCPTNSSNLNQYQSDERNLSNRGNKTRYMSQLVQDNCNKNQEITRNQCNDNKAQNYGNANQKETNKDQTNKNKTQDNHTTMQNKIGDSRPVNYNKNQGYSTVLDNINQQSGYNRNRNNPRYQDTFYKNQGLCYRQRNCDINRDGSSKNCDHHKLQNTSDKNNQISNKSQDIKNKNKEQHFQKIDKKIICDKNLDKTLIKNVSNIIEKDNLKLLKNQNFNDNFSKQNFVKSEQSSQSTVDMTRKQENINNVATAENTTIKSQYSSQPTASIASKQKSKNDVLFNVSMPQNTGVGQSQAICQSTVNMTPKQESKNHQSSQEDVAIVNISQNAVDQNRSSVIKPNVVMRYNGNKNVQLALGMDYPKHVLTSNSQKNFMAETPTSITVSTLSPIVPTSSLTTPLSSSAQCLQYETYLCANNDSTKKHGSSPVNLYDQSFQLVDDTTKQEPSSQHLFESNVQNEPNKTVQCFYDDFVDITDEPTHLEMQLIEKMLRESEIVATAKRYLATAEANLFSTQSKYQALKSRLNEDRSSSYVPYTDDNQMKRSQAGPSLASSMVQIPYTNQSPDVSSPPANNYAYSAVQDYGSLGEACYLPHMQPDQRLIVRPSYPLNKTVHIPPPPIPCYMINPTLNSVLPMYPSQNLPIRHFSNQGKQESQRSIKKHFNQ